MRLFQGHSERPPIRKTRGYIVLRLIHVPGCVIGLGLDCLCYSLFI